VAGWNKADFDAKTDYGNTPLQWAVLKDHELVSAANDVPLDAPVYDCDPLVAVHRRAPGIAVRAADGAEMSGLAALGGGNRGGVILPANFEFVGDFFDARHAADRFLGHLFLKERSHRAAERHAAFIGLEPQRFGSDVGILLYRAMHAIF
jgi:hypothetical protein